MIAICIRRARERWKSSRIRECLVHAGILLLHSKQRGGRDKTVNEIMAMVEENLS